MVKMPHWPLPMERASMKLGLENIQNFLGKLGDPHKSIPPVIHVAGTNGKGSTIAFIRAILEASGLKVHVYTSPHLLEFNERIVVAGNKIDDNFLHQLLEECRIAADKHDLQISFFEGATAAAFLAFSRIKADIVLLETGLGGRLDATNIIEKPILTVITPISFDHMDVLGDTLSKIAYEKACIMKHNVPCVIALQELETDVVLEKYANKIGAPVFRFEYDFGIIFKKSIPIYMSDDFELPMLHLSLPGDHQYVNAATAIAAVKLLKGANISNESIFYGLMNAKWPGRLQHLTDGKLKGSLPIGWEIWLDGAHNIAGMQALANWLETKITAPVYAIVGITKKRDIKAILDPLRGLITEIIGVNVLSEPLSYSAKQIAEAAQEMGFLTSCKDNAEEALKYISSKEGAPGTVVVTGSLFLVADTLNFNRN